MLTRPLLVSRHICSDHATTAGNFRGCGLERSYCIRGRWRIVARDWSYCHNGRLVGRGWSRGGCWLRFGEVWNDGVVSTGNCLARFGVGGVVGLWSRTLHFHCCCGLPALFCTLYISYTPEYIQISVSSLGCCFDSEREDMTHASHLFV